MPELTIVETPAPSPLARLVEDFLASKRAGGKSPRTLEAYEYPLRRLLLPFCEREGLTQPAQVDQRGLDRLSAQLLEAGHSGRPLSRHSVASYARHLNVFLKWARQEGELPSTARMQNVKPQRRILEVLSREEVEALEDAAETERDKLIIRLLADTGIRLGELLSLRLEDVSRQGRSHYLRVRGKGEAERLVPIPRLYPRLQRFAERGRPRDAGSERIFLARRRSPGGDYEPVTKSGVEQMLRLAARKAGIRRRVYPHLLRHSFATWSLRGGMGTLQLMQIMGHTSLDMITNVYSTWCPQDSYDAMLKLLRSAED